MTKCPTDLLKAIQIRGVKLFKGAYKGLYVELGVDIIVPEVSQTDFYFIAEFSSFFFGFANLRLSAFR